MITEKQRVARNRCIGSSDAPIILGVSPWATSHDLWLQKTGQVPPFKENAAMRLGTVLEEPLLRLAGEMLQARVVRPSSSFVGNAPYLRANIDGMVGEAARGSDIVEIKTTSMADGWGDEGTDQVPDSVRVQVAFQMGCSGSQLAHVACLIGSFGLAFKMYRLPYHAEFVEYVMRACDEWWTRHMVSGTPPDSAGTLDTLRRVTRNQATIDLPQQLFDCEQDAKAKLKTAEAEYELARATLITALGQNRRGVSTTHSVSVIEVQSERFDRKALEQEHPDLAKAFTIPTAYNRIDVRKLKGALL